MSKVFIFLIRIYQRMIAPLMPPACRYYPSCSRYAVEALQKKPLLSALGMIIWRLLRCNPFTRGGYDPVDPEPPGSHLHPPHGASRLSSDGDLK